jgi:halogenation protein CepH
MTHTFDVLVIGGGPAGATTAGLLAEQGHDVVVLEREKFPRYHIGESLVPGVNPVLDRLGLTERMEGLTFQHKNGISLLWGAERDVWTVYFAEGTPFEYTWQVKRAEFDNLLLTRARELGAMVVEEATVAELVYDDDGRAAGAIYRRGRSKEPLEISARYVIDATGQGKLVARREELLDWHEDLRNIGVWTYFQGGTQLEGKDQGNILTECHADGWFWVIPFSDGSRSVGFVGPNDAFVQSDLGAEEFFEHKLDGSREAKRLLDGATRCADYRVTKDWSYHASRFTGPGYLLAGDAAAFVDPLFSTGVMLAMKGGEAAADTVDRILRDPRGIVAAEPAQQEDYESSYRDFFDTVVSFVRYFYDARRQRTEYWTRAQEMIDPVHELEEREDFIKLISGLAGMRPVMETGREPVAAGA